jgi:GTPase SAR1 family protein
MIAHSFEIKIALLGNVSAGKTTVLNALFRGKFGEVSMKRTTAGVNYFRIATATPNEVATGTLVADSPQKDPPQAQEWSPLADDPRSATSTLKEITEDNIKLRESNQVQEKWFDIELPNELCSMRKDTKLVIVDIPGINEAGSCDKYMKYVKEKWATFDCVVVVMDGKQGVNSEEQVNLLTVVKDNLEMKDVPVIILCNKVDDPDDEEQAGLIAEARLKVEEIFAVGCRETALRKSLEARGQTSLFGQVSPAFIPISAVHAFIRQSASLMSLEQFEVFDKDLIEKLGRDQIGRRRWNKLSEEDKIQETYDILSDPSEHEEGLKDSNFDKVLAVLEHFVGGEHRQREIIESQIKTSMRALREGWPGGIANHLYSVYQMTRALNRSPEASTSSMSGVPDPQAQSMFGGTNLLSDPQAAFWKSYQAYEDSAFEQFTTSPEFVCVLSKLVEELTCYHKLSKEAGWDEEGESAVTKMKALIRRLIGVLVEQHEKYNVATWSVSAVLPNSLEWRDLSPLDWTMIWRSILLLSYDKYFCQVFGKEKILLESLAQRSNAAWIDRVSSCLDTCLHCGGSTAEHDISFSFPPTMFVPSHGFGSNPNNFPSNVKRCNGCNIVYMEKLDLEQNRCLSCPKGTVSQRHCDNASCGARYRELIDLKALVNPFHYNGKSFPVDPNPICKAVVHIHVPESLSSRKHFGHLTWTVCEFMSSLDGMK